MLSQAWLYLSVVHLHTHAFAANATASKQTNSIRTHVVHVQHIVADKMPFEIMHFIMYQPSTYYILILLI